MRQANHVFVKSSNDIHVKRNLFIVNSAEKPTGPRAPGGRFAASGMGILLITILLYDRKATIR